MDRLKLVLDSNEYVFYFNGNSNFMPKLMALQNIKIYVNELIFREVIRNIRMASIKTFVMLLKNPRFAAISENIPQELINKYKNLGLKKGNIQIAAFCEYVRANFLITENRHFLKSKNLDKFQILSINGFIAKL